MFALQKLETLIVFNSYSELLSSAPDTANATAQGIFERKKLAC
jgi:hypothetical protein